MKTVKRKMFENIPTTYEKLCQVHLPRPIHDTTDLENATEMMDLLAGHDLNKDQEDYLDLLSDLISEYEEEHIPLKTRGFGGIPALKHLLEENGMTAAGLAKLLEVDRSLGAKILRGERSLTVEHIRKLSRQFKVEAGLFVA